MGLNTGITATVKEVSTQPVEAIREQFWQHLCKRFPEAAETFGCGVTLAGHTYRFDIRYSHFGYQFQQVYTLEDMDEAIKVFIREMFREELEMKEYFLP